MPMVAQRRILFSANAEMNHDYILLSQNTYRLCPEFWFLVNEIGTVISKKKTAVSSVSQAHPRTLPYIPVLRYSVFIQVCILSSTALMWTFSSFMISILPLAQYQYAASRRRMVRSTLSSRTSECMVLWSRAWMTWREVYVLLLYHTARNTWWGSSKLTWNITIVIRRVFSHLPRSTRSFFRVKKCFALFRSPGLPEDWMGVLMTSWSALRGSTVCFS